MSISHKKDQGKRGEALVIAQILKHGCAVFLEFGDNSKTDLIVQDGKGDLSKIQVKTYNREKRTPEITKVYSYKSGPNYQFKYDANTIDWFAVVDEVTQEVAWIKASEVVSRRQLHLRHSPPKKKQPNIKMFEDYTNFPF